MTSAFSLTGSSAVVTGAGSATGIGFATAQLLCELGATVLITGASSRVHDRATELSDMGHKATAISADLTTSEGIEDVVSQTKALSSPLRILVNNAGMTSIDKPMDTTGESEGVDATSVESFGLALSRNLTSAFALTKGLLPSLRQNAPSRIIMVTSVTGAHMAMKNEVSYAAAKAGLTGLTKALALDESPHSITVNAVAPGWIATGSQTDSEKAEGLTVPMGRSGTPDEIASAIAWLASPSASYITGQTLIIDGGNSIAEERR